MAAISKTQERDMNVVRQLGRAVEVLSITLVFSLLQAPLHHSDVLSNLVELPGPVDYIEERTQVVSVIVRIIIHKVNSRRQCRSLVSVDCVETSWYDVSE
jgi:hypothetical protein